MFKVISTLFYDMVDTIGLTGTFLFLFYIVLFVGFH